MGSRHLDQFPVLICLRIYIMLIERQFCCRFKYPQLGQKYGQDIICFYISTRTSVLSCWPVLMGVCNSLSFCLILGGLDLLMHDPPMQTYLYYYNLNYQSIIHPYCFGIYNLNMQLQSENTCDQSKHSSTNNTDDLKKKISLSNSQLHQIISNSETFSQRIKQLNRQAIVEINEEAYEEAMIYLGQAEKNLQYAASCGLSIDRVLITTTLKNQACAYQRLWQLGTCYDYMEALIYNLNVISEDTKALLQSSAIKDSKSEQSKKLQKIMNQKLNVGMCYLQFSALSSQLGKHQQAQKLVEKSLGQFSQLCNYCHTFQKNTKGKTSFLLDSLVNNLNCNTSKNIKKFLKQSKAGLNKITQQRYFFSFDQKIIEKLSMGDIMQIEPLNFEQANRLVQIEWFISQIGLTYLSVYLSCCYFALATQIRLGIQKEIMTQQEATQRMLTAKMFHLHSIKLSSELVLIESNFLAHIIKSFKNNFSIDIINENFGDGEQFDDEISQIQVSNKKPDPQIKLKESHRKIVSIKKQDQDGTKLQTIDSQANSNIDKNQMHNVIQRQKISKKQGSRKVSHFQNVLATSPEYKKLTVKINSPGKQTKKAKDSKSKDKNIRQKSRSQIKNETKTSRKILNNEYFSNIQTHKKNNEKGTRNMVSPRNKVTRKPQQSRSRPKLKLKSLKSPNKF